MLHNAALKPADGSRWMLSRLSLRRPLRPADAGGMTVLITNVIGRIMTRCSLTASDGALGTMEFITGARATGTPA